MRIDELLVESQQLDELSWQDVKSGAGKVASGIGKAVGATARGVGAVAGGVAGIPSAVKQGFQKGKAAVAGAPQQEPEQQAAQQPAQQGGFAGAFQQQTGAAPQQQEPAVSSDPADLKKSIEYHKSMAAELEKQLADAGKQQKQEPAAEPAQAQQTQAEPAQQQAPAEPAQQNQPIDKTGKTDYNLGKQSDGKFIWPGQKFDSNNGQPIGGQQKAPADVRQEKQAAATQVARNQMAANPAPTPPAPTAAPADKMNPDQIAAKKAELKGRRAAGTSMAGQTGSGFKDYVAGSGERMTGVDDTGAPVFKKINRESVEFHSRFLGMII